MLHDIAPYEFHKEYKKITPKPEDTVIMFDGEMIYCQIKNSNGVLPKLHEFKNIDGVDFTYLFSINEKRFILPNVRKSGSLTPPEKYEKQNFYKFRTTGPRHLSFAIVTAQQLHQWYCSTMICGVCGAETTHSENKRQVICPECGLTQYPKISPAVIVGVINGEQILVTRYKHGPYRNYALVAGFVEIGESFEDTVRREVFEETGVHVKNLKYYKSQPWGFSSSILSGFFCQLDGDSTITLDENELSEAIWLSRSDIPPTDPNIALTMEMMEAFRTGQW